MKPQSTSKVLQPMRFVDASYKFTPTQRDFIMMVQYKTKKQKKIINDFTINLKPYFKGKGINIENIRISHYKEICDELISAKMSFQYLKGKTRYSSHNLFEYCSVDDDFNLHVRLTDNVLPLFYINKLEEGHFKENKLVRELFESSYPDFDPYVSYMPRTFVSFKEASTKVLFTKLLSNRKVLKKEFEFTKDELYHVLGYGYYKVKENTNQQQNIFNIEETEFVAESYNDAEGWKSLRKLLNKWLKEISEHKESGMTITKKGLSYFITKGRPIRTIKINVIYDEELSVFSEEEKKTYKYLKDEFLLSHSQISHIISKFEAGIIKNKIKEYMIKTDGYWGEYKRGDYRKIERTAGYVYGVVFELGKKK